MKIQNLIVAASLALVPATAMADDAKKEALKKAKEEAKRKKIEEAKAAAVEKVEKKVEKAEVKAVAKKEAKAEADEAAAKAAEEEKAMHAKNLGAIERIQQVAEATGNAELKAKAATLLEKENKRAALAAPPATGG
jgi:colicin import membrane protein